jgi:hypothetical protein
MIVGAIRFGLETDVIAIDDIIDVHGLVTRRRNESLGAVTPPPASH